MGSLSTDSEYGILSTIPNSTSEVLDSQTPKFDHHSDSETLELAFSKIVPTLIKKDSCSEVPLRKNGSLQRSCRNKKMKQVFLEGYGDDDLTRTKSLTDEDLDELQGCVDLGFGFSYDEIPELCNTLPALELCYSMRHKFLDDQHIHHNKSPNASSDGGGSSPSRPIANWKISSPGDHPEEVKARLKFWAQAVACTVKLCN